MNYQMLTKNEENIVKQMGERYYQSFVRERNFKNNERHFGLEIEFSLIDNNNFLVPGSSLSIYENLLNNYICLEYGSYQIEVHLPPLIVKDNSFKKLYDTIMVSRKEIETIGLIKNIHLLPIGIPFYIDPIRFHNKEIVTPIPRYLISTEYFHKYNKQGSEMIFCDGETINLPGNSGLSIVNELHIHLESLNMADLILLFNYSLMLTAPFISLGANSGIINKKELIHREYQITIFEQAEGLFDGLPHIPRVGLFPGYIHTIDEFFKVILSFKPLYFPQDGLDATALEIFLGKYFGWTRIRVGYEPDYHLRIEFRPMSTQPSIIENIAVSEFFINTIEFLINNRYKLLPEKYLRVNVDSSIHRGMNALLYWDLGNGVRKYPAYEILKNMVNSINSGLYSNIIIERINQKLSPAEKLVIESKKLGYKTAINNYKKCFQLEKSYI
jgi:hypothetical protein